MYPFTVLEPYLPTTGSPALGQLPTQTTPTHTYSHLIGVLMVTPSIRHFVQISISWSFFLSLSPPAALWTNKHVCVETDNTQGMSFINKGTCKNPIAMSWLREIFWLGVRHSFHLRTSHLPGIDNGHADRLSRLIQSPYFSN